MLREVIQIDEEKCNGCGLCVPDCHEGALQVIDGKVRLISDLFCDGLGACVGVCPQDALTVVKREAEAYDEAKTMRERILPKGENTVLAHMRHLKEHGADEFYRQGIEVLKELDHPALAKLEESRSEAAQPTRHAHHPGGCPGSLARSFKSPAQAAPASTGPTQSELGHWPVQMHLLNPASPHFKGSDFVLAADCTAFALGGFHSEVLKSKTLGIACPKLDQGQQVYLDKIIALIDEAKINTLTVVIMQVPCCGGLSALARSAAEQAARKVPVKQVIVSIQGEILEESWL